MHIICIPSHWWVHIRLHLWFHYNIPAKSMASNRSKSWVCFSASHIDTHQWPQTTAQVSGEYNMMPAWKKKKISLQPEVTHEPLQTSGWYHWHTIHTHCTIKSSLRWHTQQVWALNLKWKEVAHSKGDKRRRTCFQRRRPASGSQLR